MSDQAAFHRAWSYGCAPAMRARGLSPERIAKMLNRSARDVRSELGLAPRPPSDFVHDGARAVSGAMVIKNAPNPLLREDW